MRMLPIAAMIAALGACGSTPPVHEVTTVKIPVAVPCTPPKVTPPSWATASLPTGAGIYQRTQALVAEIWQRRAYERELEAAVAACADHGPRDPAR